MNPGSSSGHENLYAQRVVNDVVYGVTLYQDGSVAHLVTDMEGRTLWKGSTGSTVMGDLLDALIAAVPPRVARGIESTS